MSLINVKSPKVNVYVDTKKIEDNLGRLACCTENELPKIRTSLEVLAGIKPKEIAILEERIKMLQSRLDWVGEGWGDIEKAPERIRKEYNELSKKYNELNHEWEIKYKQYMMGDDVFYE